MQGVIRCQMKIYLNACFILMQNKFALKKNYPSFLVMLISFDPRKI